MTFQMANYYKHTRSLSTAEEVVQMACLQLLHLQIQVWECRVCIHVCVFACVCVLVPVWGHRRVHSCTCLLHITHSLDMSPEVAAGGGECGEGGSDERSVSQLFVEWQLISVPVCQDCFAESLFMLVDFFQQTPNTKASLSLHLRGWWGLPASTWAWDRSRRENKLCNDVHIFILCIFSLHTHLRGFALSDPPFSAQITKWACNRVQRCFWLPVYPDFSE